MTGTVERCLAFIVDENIKVKPSLEDKLKRDHAADCKHDLLGDRLREEVGY